MASSSSSRQHHHFHPPMSHLEHRHSGSSNTSWYIYSGIWHTPPQIEQIVAPHAMFLIWNAKLPILSSILSALWAVSGFGFPFFRISFFVFSWRHFLLFESSSVVELDNVVPVRSLCIGFVFCSSFEIFGVCNRDSATINDFVSAEWEIFWLTITA